jgi:hypothetical protein
LGEDRETFFPERGSPGDTAKKVCVNCTVRIQCLEYALARREHYGIWGGLTERERTRLRLALATSDDPSEVFVRMSMVRIGRRHARAS